MPRHVKAAATERALVVEDRTLGPGQETVLSDTDWAKAAVQALVTGGHLIDLGATTDAAPHPGSTEDRVAELEQEADSAPPAQNAYLTDPTTTPPPNPDAPTLWIPSDLTTIPAPDHVIVESANRVLAWEVDWKGGVMPALTHAFSGADAARPTDPTKQGVELSMNTGVVHDAPTYGSGDAFQYEATDGDTVGQWVGPDYTPATVGQTADKPAGRYTITMWVYGSTIPNIRPVLPSGFTFANPATGGELRWWNGSEWVTLTGAG